MIDSAFGRPLRESRVRAVLDLALLNYIWGFASLRGKRTG